MMMCMMGMNAGFVLLLLLSREPSNVNVVVATDKYHIRFEIKSVRAIDCTRAQVV